MLPISLRSSVFGTHGCRWLDLCVITPVSDECVLSICPGSPQQDRRAPPTFPMGVLTARLGRRTHTSAQKCARSVAPNRRPEMTQVFGQGFWAGEKFEDLSIKNQIFFGRRFLGKVLGMLLGSFLGDVWVDRVKFLGVLLGTAPFFFGRIFGHGPCFFGARFWAHLDFFWGVFLGRTCIFLGMMLATRHCQPPQAFVTRKTCFLDFSVFFLGTFLGWSVRAVGRH